MSERNNRAEGSMVVKQAEFIMHRGRANRAWKELMKVVGCPEDTPDPMQKKITEEED